MINRNLLNAYKLVIAIALICILLNIIIKIFGPPWKWGKGNNKRPIIKPNPANTIRLKPEQMPGLADQCKKHSEKLVRVCTEVGNIDKKIDQLLESNEKEHNRLWDRITQISDKI
jgi:hypothetical protein